jgi:LysM repeat protein
MPMAGRSPARFIAPLALVAFALALFIVVSSTTKDDAGTPGARDAGQPAQTTATATGGRKRRKEPRSYTVKSGDTPSGIAEKVNVPLDTILELNPDLDPQTLTPGTKIKLR